VIIKSSSGKNYVIFLTILVSIPTKNDRFWQF